MDANKAVEGENLKCPVCRKDRFQETDGIQRCLSCGWKGVVYDGHPRVEDSAPAELAKLEDAVCANHPGKKAIAVCAGTGDYICSLCRVHLNGQDYSVQYLDRGGKVLANQTFTQRMDRPDRMVRNMLVLTLIIGVLGPVFFIYSCVCLSRALRKRREDAIFQKIIAPFGMWVCWSIHLLHTLAIVGFFAAGFIGAFASAR